MATMRKARTSSSASKVSSRERSPLSSPNLSPAKKRLFVDSSAKDLSSDPELQAIVSHVTATIMDQMTSEMESKLRQVVDETMASHLSRVTCW